MTEAAIVDFQMTEVLLSVGIVTALTCVFAGIVLLVRSYFK